MFTIEHFIWMGICVGMILALNVCTSHFHLSFHQASLIMLGIAVLSETSKIISNMIYANGIDANHGMVLNAEALPFHLCSLLLFAIFYFPFAKNEKLKNRLVNFFVPIGLIGAGAAILMATNGTDFKTMDAYQCFIYHAGMMWFAIYLIRSKQADLSIKEWKKNIITLLALVVIMIWVNSILQVYDTNFMYVVRPPVENLPFLNLNHGWFVYMARLILLGFAGLTIVHLPFMIRKENAN